VICQKVAILIASGCLLTAGYAEATAQRPQGATLRIVVKDPSGAVIPGALLQVRGTDERTTAVTRQDVPSDPQGIAILNGLTPGRYIVEVSFPGFETLVIPDLRLRAGENRRDAVLAIQKIDENLSVGRDPSTVASDPNGDRFNTVLSRDQIEALPDDPDEMERVLKEMAGPGATIRVDGFRGGKLPPKSQIRAIRFSRDMLAAENHAAGMVFVDIVTQPGLGPLRGSVDFLFRDDSLNARNAFQPAKGPEQTQQYALNLNGTLRKERTSFSLAATGASLYDSANVFAALPDGSRAAPIRRPADRTNFNGRLDHAINNAHTLRVNFQQNDNDQRNLGVGSYDLSERAYARAATDRTFRLSESGPLGRSAFGESRVQLRWGASRNTSDLEAPSVRVLDAFTSGGAQQAGGRESTDLEWATNVDWAKGRHAVRAGALIEAGWYRSDTRTNYLGTYTFTSLADYQAGHPATYTRRLGDPLVEFSQWQAGLFVQDDWRARSNLTISGGLRYEAQTRLRDGVNLAPRVGVNWSPFRHGKTTVRGGVGVFYDWLESEVVEQTLRVDGSRQQDLVIANPGYPDPFSGGAAQQVLPASTYVLAPELVMPYRVMLTAGVSHQFSPAFGLNLNYNRTRGYNRFRGRNINAPLADGLRPDPAAGNVTQVESTAALRGETVSVGVNFSLPARRTFLFANYVWMRQENDADGALSLPASSYDLAAEWGPSAGIPRHIFSAMASSTLFKNLRVSLAASGRSGTPYNVTTGRDDNGDTVFNDRPAGVGRNSRIGSTTWDTNARVSYAFGFGQRPSSGAPAGGVMIAHRVTVGGASGGDVVGAFGGGADDKRIRFELFASASNLLNHVNRTGYSGVMTSPFFGRPTAAMPGRRVDVGVRIGF
jgi:hypothetical protein